MPGQRDHKRPLDKRGIAETKKLGKWLTTERIFAEQVLCSTATRATETLALVAPHLARKPSVKSCDALYALGTDAYFGAVQRAHDRTSIMVVGHNPMIEEFSLALCKGGDEASLTILREGFPTCGLAVVELDGPAQTIRPGSGTLLMLVDPRKLD